MLPISTWLCVAPAGPLLAEEAPLAKAEVRKEPPLFATRDLRLRFRVVERGAADIVGYLLHYTLDGGQSWASQEAKPEGPSLLFRAPRDGRYGFTLSVVDAVGAASSTPAPLERPVLEAVVDTAPPVIRVVRPAQREEVVADSQAEIEWEVRDENLGTSPLEVAASLDGRPWEVVWGEAPAKGRRTWNLPLLAGEVRLRFRARDLAGNSAEVTTPPVYRIISGPAPSRWLAVAPHSRSRRVPIYYRLVRDGAASAEPLAPEELRKVQVWYRKDSGEWNPGDVDPDRRSPLELQVPEDGWFDLLISALDSTGRWIPPGSAPGPDGRMDRNLAPHARCLVDTVEPRVGIEEPAGGAWIEAGAPLAIRYWVEEENPRPRGVTISSSLDGGKSWTLLGAELEPQPSETIHQSRGELRLDLPSIESEGFLLKVTALDLAGNAGEAVAGLERPLTILNRREDAALKAEEHYRRGVLRLRSSDLAERRRAVESFRRALAYRPDHVAAEHDLAVALEEGGSQVEGEAAGPSAEDPLAHYRRAHAADPGDPRFASSLVASLVKRAEESDGEAAGPLMKEAEAVFQKISWIRLVEIEDREESQRLRRQYRAWKDHQFSGLPR